MKSFAPLALVLLGSVPASAEILPQPGIDNPRIQTARWAPGEDVVLTALPMTGLTVMLEPGEEIARVSIDNRGLLDVRVSSERDSLLVIPQVEEANGVIEVQTDRRDYRFQLRTGSGLMAAYLVRFEFDETQPQRQEEAVAREWDEPTGELWGYRLRGDRSVRPSAISDDGVRTRILFDEEQALPGIFAIGPTGEEQVVNGHMREGVFVIDRVWEELVFRIDKDKATARRNSSPEAADG